MLDLIQASCRTHKPRQVCSKVNCTWPQEMALDILTGKRAHMNYQTCHNLLVHASIQSSFLYMLFHSQITDFTHQQSQLAKLLVPPRKGEQCSSCATKQTSWWIPGKIILSIMISHNFKTGLSSHRYCTIRISAHLIKNALEMTIFYASIEPTRMLYHCHGNSIDQRPSREIFRSTSVPLQTPCTPFTFCITYVQRLCENVAICIWDDILDEQKCG